MGVSDSAAEAEASQGVRASPDDRYAMSTLLGRGAMGEVWRGQHVMMKRDVAIKFLTPEVAGREELKARFLREAQALSQLDHPNVCRALDFGEDGDGGLYLVMEFVEGETLGELLKREGQAGLEPDRAFDIVRQIVVGIAIAHESGIVHRDLKPDNVMLTLDARGNELVKLMDFGIAKVNAPEDQPQGDTTKLTQAGTIFGTPAYMAPEQAVGEQVDAAADVYALGSMLYEMLTGTPPFDEDSIWAVLRAKLERDPEPLPAGSHSRRVRDLVARMMSRVPEERPSIPSLEAELAGLHGEALKPGSEPTQRPWKALVAALVVLVVAMVAVMGLLATGPALGTDAKGLQVLSTAIAPRLEKKEPADMAERLKPSRKLYCHVAVKTNHPRSLTLAWFRDGQEVGNYKIRVKPSNRYRSWARFSAKKPGNYRCDVRNKDGVRLGTANVDVAVD